MAEAKRLQARTGAKSAQAPIAARPMSDYVLTVEGDEPLRMLRDAKEDLHDTVFLELENGGTLDLIAVKFIDDGDTDAVRTELHFAKTLDGQPAIDPKSEKVIFHCLANAKKEMQNRQNALSFRVEFLSPLDESPRRARFVTVPRFEPGFWTTAVCEPRRPSAVVVILRRSDKHRRSNVPLAGKDLNLRSMQDLGAGVFRPHRLTTPIA
jgi:hypothetical protein